MATLKTSKEDRESMVRHAIQHIRAADDLIRALVRCENLPPEAYGEWTDARLPMLERLIAKNLENAGLLKSIDECPQVVTPVEMPSPETVRICAENDARVTRAIERSKHDGWCLNH